MKQANNFSSRQCFLWQPIILSEIWQLENELFLYNSAALYVVNGTTKYLLMSLWRDGRSGEPFLLLSDCFRELPFSPISLPPTLTSNASLLMVGELKLLLFWKVVHHF